MRDVVLAVLAEVASRRRRRRRRCCRARRPAPSRRPGTTIAIRCFAASFATASVVGPGTGLGRVVPALVLAGAEVRAVEDLLQAEHLDALLAGLLDERHVLVEHRLLDRLDRQRLVVDRIAALDRVRRSACGASARSSVRESAGGKAHPSALGKLADQGPDRRHIACGPNGIRWLGRRTVGDRRAPRRVHDRPDRRGLASRFSCRLSKCRFSPLRVVAVCSASRRPSRAPPPFRSFRWTAGPTACPRRRSSRIPTPARRWSGSSSPCCPTSPRCRPATAPTRCASTSSRGRSRWRPTSAIAPGPSVARSRGRCCTCARATGSTSR